MRAADVSRSQTSLVRVAFNGVAHLPYSSVMLYMLVVSPHPHPFLQPLTMPHL